jgi:tetratricopeptide (TPR) repeat protein
MAQMALPPTQRTSWDEVEPAVNSASAADPDSTPLILLRVEFLTRGKKFDDAESLLVQSRERRPDEIGFWTGLATLAVRRGDLGQAEEVLEQAFKKFGNRVELLLAEVVVALNRERSEVAKRLSEIAARTGELSSDDRRRVERLMAQGYQQIGQPKEGLALWKSAARESDLDDQLLLAELAAGAGDLDFLGQLQKAILKIEGPNGPNGNYVEAAGKLMQYVRERPGDNDLLEKARVKLRDAERDRPHWAAVPRSLGLLEELCRNHSEALQHFRRALELGDRSRDTVRRVVEHLVKQGNLDEAQKEIDRAVATAPDALSPELARLASQVAWARGELVQAREMADRVPPESRGYADLLRQAELAFAAGRRGAEVEALTQQATELAPQIPQTWLVRVALLVQEGKTDDAREVAMEAADKLPAEPAYVRPLALGSCYEVLGDPGTAEKHFVDAVEADPRHFLPRLELAKHYIRTNELDKALRHTEALLDPAIKAPKGVVDAARHARAMITAQRGTYDDLQAALQMLPPIQSDRELQKAVDRDLQTIAGILSKSRLRRERLQLVRVLSELQRRKVLEGAERLNLARLLEADGNWPEARRIYRELLGLDPINPLLLAEFALSSLRGNKKFTPETLDEVAEAVERLEHREPDSFRAVLARARLTAAEGRAPDAVPILMNYLKRLEAKELSEQLRQFVAAGQPDKATKLLDEAVRQYDEPGARLVLIQLQQLQSTGNDARALATLQKYIQEVDLSETVFTHNLGMVAGALESLGQPQAAEEVLRQAVAGKRSAGRLLALIRFVARRSGIDEALDLCDEAEGAVPPTVLAGTAIAVLRSHRPGTEQIERVEKRIASASAAAAPSEKPRLDLVMAELRDIQGRYADMAAVYRKLIEENDRNVMALNNLAWFLSFEPRGQREESLELINRAIRVAGPHSELLDTRAVVQLNLDNPAEAIADLGIALQDAATSSMWFHLAVAQSRKGDQAEAAEALRRAEQAGFDPQSLHPLEEASYEKLIKSLPARGG